MAMMEWQWQWTKGQMAMADEERKWTDEQGAPTVGLPAPPSDRAARR